MACARRVARWDPRCLMCYWDRPVPVVYRWGEPRSPTLSPHEVPASAQTAPCRRGTARCVPLPLLLPPRCYSRTLASVHPLPQFASLWGSIWYTDLSKNGTRLNGELIPRDAPTLLRSGDRLTVGGEVLLVRIIAAAPETAAAAIAASAAAVAASVGPARAAADSGAPGAGAGPSAGGAAAGAPAASGGKRGARAK